MSNNKIEFKVVTDENNSSVSFGEVTPKAALAFTKLIESITEIAIEINPNAKIEIFNGSLGVRVETNEDEALVLTDTIETLLERDYRVEYSIDPWNKVLKLIHANGITYETSITHNGVKKNFTSEIKKSKKFFRKRGPKATYSYSLKFLTGKLIEVGGKNPNIHLDIANRLKPLKVDCTEGNARKAMPFLYNIISISAWERKENGFVKDYEFCDVYGSFELYESYKTFVELISECTEEQRLSLVYDRCLDFIENEDLGGLNKFLRIFRHPSINVNTLHTLLMLTSKFNYVDDKKLSENISNEEERERKIKEVKTIKETWGILKEYFDSTINRRTENHARI